MLLEIPPKMSISSFIGHLKGKSSTMLYEQFSELKYKYRNRKFWCKGYYVDIVGKNANRIADYIANQLKEDQMQDQLTLESESPVRVANNNIAVSRLYYAFYAYARNKDYAYM